MLNDWWFRELFWNASPIEIIWSTVGLFGLIYASVNFYRDMKSLGILQIQAKDELLHMAAKGLAIQQALSVIAFLMFLSIGIIASVFNPGDVGGKIISWMLVLAMFTVAAKTYYTKRTSDQVINYDGLKGE